MGEKKINVYLFDKTGCPEEFAPMAEALAERGRISYSENKFLVIEGEKETSVAAVMKEGFPRDNADKVKDYFANLTKFLRKEGLSDVALHFEILDDSMMFNVAEGLKIGEYFYKKGDKKEFSLNFELVPALNEKADEDFKRGLRFAEILFGVRDMVNTTSEIMTPHFFAEETKRFLSGSDVKVEVMDKNDLEKNDFKAMLSVSRGGYNEHCAVLMRYMGDPENPGNVTALLGKGVTYDSGGLSLKTKTGMITMHDDMGGAAAVVGAMRMINELKPKKNVLGMCALSENMLSEYAYRPGEIIDSMAGKTILVNSTDAEGRLLLCDGLWYLIHREKVSRVADIATLTGGVVKALGKKITGFMSNDEDLSSCMVRAGEKSGEPVWRLPLVDDYRDKIKPVQADLTNSTLGDGPAAITAGLFLEEFAGDTPWVHVDCAGTAFYKYEKNRYSYGGTGVGAELLCDWVMEI